MVHYYETPARVTMVDVVCETAYLEPYDGCLILMGVPDKMLDKETFGFYPINMDI